jgi:hypothetical protein
MNILTTARDALRRYKLRNSMYIKPVRLTNEECAILLTAYATYGMHSIRMCYCLDRYRDAFMEQTDDAAQITRMRHIIYAMQNAITAVLDSRGFSDKHYWMRSHSERVPVAIQHRVHWINQVMEYNNYPCELKITDTEEAVDIRMASK